MNDSQRTDAGLKQIIGPDVESVETAAMNQNTVVLLNVVNLVLVVLMPSGGLRVDTGQRDY